ncbi:hypothetical protein A5823_002849 [Enterococcus faecalis]|uniref:hypothetical protein n=1 Tax=Enterococcus faecalis TaxID=1351 RepID=UPI000A335335|nr:hypothetical protein [Enterococcus faecalis]OTP25093.1 hypothetical protein A5823_002849 [Enterococcus faecalis]
MEKEETKKKKYLLNMAINESYEFAKGFGLRHLGHFILLFFPLSIVVWVLFTPVQSEVVRMAVRIFSEGTLIVLLFLIVRLRRFQHSSMTYLSIVSERLGFAIRKRSHRTTSYYDKGDDTE